MGRRAKQTEIPTRPPLSLAALPGPHGMNRHCVVEVVAATDDDRLEVHVWDGVVAHWHPAMPSGRPRKVTIWKTQIIGAPAAGDRRVEAIERWHHDNPPHVAAPAENAKGG